MEIGKRIVVLHNTYAASTHMKNYKHWTLSLKEEKKGKHRQRHI